MVIIQKAQIVEKQIISKKSHIFLIFFSKFPNIIIRLRRNFIIIGFETLYSAINTKQKLFYDLRTKGTKYEISKKKFVKIGLIFWIFSHF